MNPNKHKPTRWKDLELCKNCGDKEFGPDVVDRKTGLCAECLVGALERENKELKGEIEKQQVDNAELASRLSVQCDNVKQALDTRDELRQQRDALKARAELLASTNTELGMQVKKAEAKLAAIEKKEISTTVKVGFEVREVVANYEAKLAEIEKDLRDILKSLYCPDEGYLEIETSEIYNDIHGLLGKHFPDKKAVGKRKEDE